MQQRAALRGGHLGGNVRDGARVGAQPLQLCGDLAALRLRGACTRAPAGGSRRMLCARARNIRDHLQLARAYHAHFNAPCKHLLLQAGRMRSRNSETTTSVIKHKPRLTLPPEQRRWGGYQNERLRTQNEHHAAAGAREVVHGEQGRCDCAHAHALAHDGHAIVLQQLFNDRLLEVEQVLRHRAAGRVSMRSTSSLLGRVALVVAHIEPQRLLQ